MKKFLVDCPVPTDQQPMNEYSNLKGSIFFFWTTKDLNSYIKSTLFLMVGSYFMVFALIYSSTPNSTRIDPVTFITYLVIFGNGVLNLYFIRLYLGWVYIYDRLMKASISYEESGWYDGQTWVKTPNVLIQDKLVAEYQVGPILNRIQLTIFSFASLWLLGIIHIYL
jgi:hypothetical protein